MSPCCYYISFLLLESAVSLIVVGTLRVPSLIVVGTLRVPSLMKKGEKKFTHPLEGVCKYFVTLFV